MAKQLFEINLFTGEITKYLQFMEQSLLNLYLFVGVMGCANSNAINVIRPSKKKETICGVLKIKLQEALVEHDTSKYSTMDPYVVVKFSNQKGVGEVVAQGGRHPKFNDSFRFFVNSQYKSYGRCLEIQLMDKSIASDDVIGFGIIDLDPYLSILNTKAMESELKQSSIAPKQDHSTILRCFLSYDRRQAGFITISASFKEEKAEYIYLRFETAELKRNTRTFFGEMNCSVRVTIGEEVLQTKKSKDTKTEKPVWKDEYLTFLCPRSIQDVLIEVMDEDRLVGGVTIAKSVFMLDEQQGEFIRQIKFKQSVVGKLWFNSQNSFNPIFKQLHGDYKKILPGNQAVSEEKPKVTKVEIVQRKQETTEIILKVKPKQEKKEEQKSQMKIQRPNI